jgi:UDP-N-acetylmuramate dehydrogenase
MTQEINKYMFPKGLFEGEVRYRESMRDHTSLKIGGQADIFVKPKDMRSLMNMHKRLKENQIPILPLGGGTNILVRDGGIAGSVLSLTAMKCLNIIKEEDEHVYLFTEAGVLLSRLVSFSNENGYSGIEGLVGIPGTVGGAICGNAGAFDYEIKDALVSVEKMDADGNTEVIQKGDIVFGYRSASFLQEDVILSAVLRLTKGNKREISARIEEFLKIKRGRQPIWEASAGCVFKNPPGFSAGQLIEQTGCKGMRIGEIEISTIHANFFINKGKGSASDFLRLMQKVIEKVQEKFAVILAPEIRIVGRDLVNG